MKSGRTEEWLKENQVKFEYVQRFPFAKIKVESETRENIRVDGISLDHAASLLAAFDSGRQLGPVVLYEIPEKGVFSYIDGLHRHYVYKQRGVEMVEAYLVEVIDPIMIEKMQRTVNAGHGWPPPMPERMIHADRLMALGYVQADAARLMFVPEDRFGKYIRARDIRRDLAKQGVPEADLDAEKTKDFTILSIGAIKNPQIRARVFNLAKQARLRAEELKELVRDIREQRSDDRAHRVCDEWDERYAREKQRSEGGFVRPPGSSLKSLPATMAKAERIMGMTDKEHWFKSFTHPELSRLLADCKKFDARLHVLMDALTKASRRAKRR